GAEAGAALRLSLLAVECAEDGERLRARLALSNAEADIFLRTARASERLRGDGFRLSPPALRALIYRHGPQAGPAALAMLAAAGRPAGPELAAAANWTPPPPPWRGADALAAGEKPGPAIGRLLAAAE